MKYFLKRTAQGFATTFLPLGGLIALTALWPPFFLYVISAVMIVSISFVIGVKIFEPDYYE